MVGNLPRHPGRGYFPMNWRLQSPENGLFIVQVYVGFLLYLFNSFVWFIPPPLSLLPRRFTSPARYALKAHWTISL
ncbi:hypothetical protein CGRA01v4_07643 [Colletotrichum graminicola]|nr:hypothetical protein CGRA01v4_07643 [Colletotrichum graminicola]